MVYPSYEYGKDLLSNKSALFLGKNPQNEKNEEKRRKKSCNDGISNTQQEKQAEIDQSFFLHLRHKDGYLNGIDLPSRHYVF